MTHAEVARQMVHIGVGAIAFSLVWLTWPQAAVLAIAATLFNLVVLPRLTRRVFRDGDLDHPWASGIVLYPLAVLGLVLVFRERLDLVAAAWGILAAGDGMATLVGTSVRSPRLPWNPDKSLAGLVAFVVSGALAAITLMAWTAGTAVSGSIVAIAVCAATVAALVETVPIRLNDNLSVPAAAALVLWSGSLFDASIFSARWPDLQSVVVLGLAANIGVAMLGWMARTVTLPGAIAGAVIGTIVVIGAGWAGWALLLLTFVVASACTRLGHARKAAAGIAEDRGGRRGVGNAVANTGLAAGAAAIALGLADPAAAWLVLVAALATAGSDTVASEVGKACGRTTWQVTTLRRVPPGTTGAVSLEGTLAGVAAAALLAAAGAAWGLVPVWTISVITVAAAIASLIEGALGATLESQGILNNDTLNFVNAAMGAALTLVAWTWWPL
jgi:uncharacterized protein (TIGR00297 family)